jgi:hypothetical protein
MCLTFYVPIKICLAHNNFLNVSFETHIKIHCAFQIMKNSFHYNSMKMPIINHKLIHNSHCLSNIKSCTYHYIHETHNNILKQNNLHHFWTNLHHYEDLYQSTSIFPQYIYIALNKLFGLVKYDSFVSPKNIGSHLNSPFQLLQKVFLNSFNKIKSLETKIKPLTYKVMITKMFT